MKKDKVDVLQGTFVRTDFTWPFNLFYLRVISISYTFVVVEVLMFIKIGLTFRGVHTLCILFYRQYKLNSQWLIIKEPCSHKDPSYNLSGKCCIQTFHFPAL